MAQFAVERMTDADRSATVGALARAFYKDPLFDYLQPDLAKQPRFIAGIMRPSIVDAQPFGEVWVARAGADIAAAAVWLPPGSWPRGWQRDMVLNARSLLPLLSIWRKLPDAYKLLTEVDHAHYNGEHWYLAILGCDPTYQRTGAGSALLRAVIARADDDHVPVYLETQKEANLAYYARFGCEVVDKIQVGAMPPIWTLLRDAR